MGAPDEDGGVASGLTKDMSVTLAAQALLVSGLRAWAILSDHPNWAACNVLFACGWMIRCAACVLSDITNGAPHRN